MVGILAILIVLVTMSAHTYRSTSHYPVHRENDAEIFAAAIHSGRLAPPSGSVPLQSAKNSDATKLQFSIKPIPTSNPPPMKVVIDAEKLGISPREAKPPVQGIFETTLDARQQEGKVRLTLSLRNISGEDLLLTYGSGQQYDFFVYNEQHEEVYRWSYDKSFITVIWNKELGIDEEVIFEEEWALEDNEGEPVPAGRYIVKGQVMSGLIGETVGLSESTAEIAIDME